MHEYKSTDFLDSIRDLDGAEVVWLLEHLNSIRNALADNRPALGDALTTLVGDLHDELQTRPARDAAEVEALHRLMADAPEFPEDADLDTGGGWGRPPSREV